MANQAPACISKCVWFRIPAKDYGPISHNRGNSQAWQFAPLVDYHGGSNAALEPFSEHYDAWEWCALKRIFSSVSGLFSA